MRTPRAAVTQAPEDYRENRTETALLSIEEASRLGTDDPKRLYLR